MALEAWAGRVDGSQIRVTLERVRGRTWRVGMSELTSDGEFFTHADAVTTHIARTRAVLRGDGFVRA